MTYQKTIAFINGYETEIFDQKAYQNATAEPEGMEKLDTFIASNMALNLKIIKNCLSEVEDFIRADKFVEVDKRLDYIIKAAEISKKTLTLIKGDKGK